jgi:hypothetical protein
MAKIIAAANVKLRIQCSLFKPYSSFATSDVDPVPDGFYCYVTNAPTSRLVHNVYSTAGFD